jgi:cytidylate kinase
MSFVVTIDGPAAAGKSTTARAIAQRLGWRYLDTGAFYRALGLKALRTGTTLTAANAREFARGTAVAFSGDPLNPHVQLDGVDVTDDIRTPEVSDAASRAAALPDVRRQLVEWQRHSGRASSSWARAATSAPSSSRTPR